MEILIRQTRSGIDEIFTLAGTLDPSREIASAKTSFEVSKMMLGKVLSTMGTTNPYPDSKNPESPKIEPTAEKSEPLGFPEGIDHVTKVKTLRQEADHLCKRIEEMRLSEENSSNPPVWNRVLFLNDAYLECQKGMMWLGMELGRIRDTANQETTVNS